MDFSIHFEDFLFASGIPRHFGVMNHVIVTSYFYEFRFEKEQTFDSNIFLNHKNPTPIRFSMKLANN